MESNIVILISILVDYIEQVAKDYAEYFTVDVPDIYIVIQKRISFYIYHKLNKKQVEFYLLFLCNLLFEH